jgi:hypothetical protein
MNKLFKIIICVFVLFSVNACDKNPNITSPQKNSHDQVTVTPQQQSNIQSEPKTQAVTLKAEIYDRWSSTWSQYVHTLKIQAIQDEIKITKLIVNKGNCNFFDVRGFPVSLKFGEFVEYMVDGCAVLEVTIETETGSQTFNWN